MATLHSVPHETIHSDSPLAQGHEVNPHPFSDIHTHLSEQVFARPRRLFIQFVFFIAASSIVFTGLYKVVVPSIIEKFITQNLKPAEAQVMSFNGVLASPNAEGVRSLGASPEISRTTINGEIIFDLTPSARNSDEHGYTKASHEWYIKTPVLGEEAILLTPSIALGIGLGLLSMVLVLFCTLLLPPQIGLFSALVEQSIIESRFSLGLQTGLQHEDLDVLSIADTELQLLANSKTPYIQRAFERIWSVVGIDFNNRLQIKNLQLHSYPLFREYCLRRMSEVCSPNIAAHVRNLSIAESWRKGRYKLLSALKFYMEESFVPRFSNVVSGLAYSGAAFLIVSVGLRGLRFIPASRPSILLATISLECACLLMLGITLSYQREESNGIESIKRIEHGMSDVARVMKSVDTSVIERVLQESAAEYAKTPEMQQRVFANIAEKALDAIRKQPASETP